MGHSNNLYLITYSICIVQPSEKIHMELIAIDSVLFTQFSHVLTFSTDKICLKLPGT